MRRGGGGRGRGREQTRREAAPALRGNLRTVPEFLAAVLFRLHSRGASRRGEDAHKREKERTNDHAFVVPSNVPAVLAPRFLCLSLPSVFLHFFFFFLNFFLPPACAPLCRRETRRGLEEQKRGCPHGPTTGVKVDFFRKQENRLMHTFIPLLF